VPKCHRLILCAVLTSTIGPVCLVGGSLLQMQAVAGQQQSEAQRSISNDRVRNALALLGKPRAYESAGCSSIAALTELDPTEKGILASRGLLGLPDIVKEGGTKCPDYQFVATVTENPEIAVIERAMGLVGDAEAGRLQLGATSQNVIWHRYGWLHFGTVDGKVIAVRGDSKGYLQKR